MASNTPPHARAATVPTDDRGLPPRPQPPQVIEIEPCTDHAAFANDGGGVVSDTDRLFSGTPLCPGRPGGVTAPRSPLIDDQVPADWVYICPPQGDWPAALGANTCDPAWKAAIHRIIQHMGPLPPSAWVDDCYPDFIRAIDINAIIGDRQRAGLLMLTIVENDRPRLVRACVGATGEGVAARLWLAGHELAHGDYARLKPGAYPLVVFVQVGNRDRPWQWKGRNLATRFTEVTQREIDAEYACRLGWWRRTRDAADTDIGPLLDKVRIDPATLRGHEGFFRVGKDTDGRWWLIDPDGRPFYYKGICALNRGGIGGRRMLKPPLPDETVDDWLATLGQWGFNALGCWTTPEFFERGVPHTEMIDTFYIEPFLQYKFPDVFDPQWRRNLRDKCRAICEPQRDSRALIGYFLENERGFMETVGRGVEIVANGPVYVADHVAEPRQVVNAAEPILNAKRLGLLQFCLSLDESLPGAARAWRFLLERHGGVAAAGRAWGIELSSKLAINELTVNGLRLISPAYLKDEQDFLRIWVDQYFKVTIEAVREFDPNHLILGVRWAGTPGSVVLEQEAKWTDAVSQNNYRAEMAWRLEYTTEQVDLPMLIGEFQTTIDSLWYVPNPIEPPGGYRDAEERQAIRAVDCMDQTFAHRSIIGYTLYKWGGSKPGDDKVRLLWHANHRAELVATAPVDRDSGSLTGQVFLSLQSGLVEVESLPAPREGDRPSQRIRHDALYLGLVCRDGTWEPRVHGNGVRGRVTRQRRDGDLMHLSIEIEMHPGMYTFQEGQGRYDLTLTRCGGQLRGHFTGTCNDIAAEGKALAYLHRTEPSTRV
ncbi:MAG: hypothetical protein JJU36_16905 [Phycisphaeraceae bacterium]|nr:hypothetical protein [Phycisphaeraceae bacterium]